MHDTRHPSPFRRLLPILGIALLSCNGIPLKAEPPSKDYKLLYEEEFKGDSLNTNDWKYREGFRSGGSMFNNSLNRKKNVTVSNNELHIATYQETVDGKLCNTGGGVISKHQFGYGYYETLSKPFMAAKGVHSSFWQAGGCRGNNNLFEIDGYEIDSKQPMACHNLYIQNDVPWPTRDHQPLKLLPDGGYLLGYEITPEGVIFYENGKKIARADWNELTAAQTVLLTALNGTGKVDDGAVGDTTFQYFRYYGKDYPGVNLLPNGDFEYTQKNYDLAKPIAWEQVSRPSGSGVVTEGGAFHGNFKLRQGNDSAPYEVTTRQTLEFLGNGDYELTAAVRSSGGQERAAITVSGYGGDPLEIPISASEEWTPVSLPKIPVTSHQVTITVASKGSPGQWVEIDDIRFQKPPLPGQKSLVTPYVHIPDPIWSQGTREPLLFTGDGRFFFFDRNVGFGDAVTVTFAMKPAKLANTSPIARAPKTGNDGWSVQLTDKGVVLFRIGSAESYKTVKAENSYTAGKQTHVACVFDHGKASIYINGVLKAVEQTAPYACNDRTSAGRMGAVTDLFDAISDVIVLNEKAAKSKKWLPKYVGELRDVRVYNRVLTPAQISDLASVGKTQK
jgi:hypothetical protein